MRRAVETDVAAVDELAALRAYDRAKVLAAIRQLVTNADDGKVITALVPGWGEPVRQVRVGDYRVFYSIDGATVFVHAVRRKGTKTTKEVLR